MSYFISSGGGTGSSAIDTVKVNQFKEGFATAFQQMDVRLAGAFRMETQDTEYAYHDRIGIAEEMQEDTVRYGDNPQSEIDMDRRRTQVRDYELGKYIEPKDLHRVLTDPTAPVIAEMRKSGHRKIDDIVRDNIFGIAKAGKAGATEVSFVDQGFAGEAGDALISVGEMSKVIVTQSQLLVIIAYKVVTQKVLILELSMIRLLREQLQVSHWTNCKQFVTQ